MKRAYEKGSKKNEIWEPFKLENLVRVQAGARFCSFVRFQKKLDLGCLLELHFGAFGTFLRRKHSFLAVSYTHLTLPTILLV